MSIMSIKEQSFGMYVISFQMTSPAGLADAEYQEPGVLRGGFQHVAGLANENGDIDRGQGIGAFEHQRVARDELGEHLAGFERRQGAAQSAQVERLFGHASL